MDEAVRIAERVEAAAIEDFCQSPPETLRRGLGLVSSRIDGALVAQLASATDPMLNRVIGLGVERPASASDLDLVVGKFQAAGVGRYFVHLTPGARPAELRQQLLERGFLRYRRSWAKFVWAGGGLATPRPGLRVTLAAAEHAQSFARIVASAFGLPAPLEPVFSALVARERWRVYLCFDGDTPFAAGALFIDQRAAWLGFGATLTSHRGRGGQSAILAQRVRDALALGCHTVTTETGEEVPDQPQISYRNIVRTGFRVHYVRENFVSA